MTLSLILRQATADDAASIAEIRNAAARDLGAQFGPGMWAGEESARGVLPGMRQSTLWIGALGGEDVATFRLSTRKPWAIDRKYFTPVPRPLYLTNMAVVPAVQRKGVGRWCLEQAEAIARAHPAQAIWLDAFDAPAGAGEFYARCGYREVGRAAYRGNPLIYYEFPLDLR